MSAEEAIADVRAKQRTAIKDLWALLKWQACIASCPAQQRLSPSRKAPHSATCPEGQLRRAIRELQSATGGAVRP